MGTRSKKGLVAGAGLDYAELSYLSDIYQEVVSLDIDEVKMIPHADGKGYSFVHRGESITTMITNRFVKDGFFKKSFKYFQDVTEIKEDGVYHNGRKL